ncbi:glutamyl-tRNA(Gln) amidotransferase subunit A [Bacillus freudenreichii]|nr:glutamyl-tRNA(Gln) amidotransferase subunit A [Bacillus freudenreichii]
MVREQELLNLDITSLHTEYKNRSISPVEVVEWVFKRIDKYAHLNAYITVCHQEGMRQAQQAEKLFREGNEHRGLLLGIPLGLKDLIQTKGIRTTSGSAVYNNFIPKEDATVVKILKESGSVIVGKQNTHELAYGTTGDDSYFGPMRNPYQPEKIAGGSSGGSASATAVQLCWGSLGTDTSGSIRIPSALCGIVGMKPTYGKINTDGIQQLSKSMDHVGPITRTVMDNAIIFDALLGNLESAKSISRSLRESPKSNLKNKKIGIPASYFYDEVDEEVKEKVLSLTEILENLGATVIDIHLDIPKMKEAMEISSAIDRSEAYLIHREIVHDPGSLLGEVTRNRILQGSEYRAYEFVIAQNLKEEITAEYRRAFQKVDALLTPTVPILPTKIGEENISINGNIQSVRSALMRFTFLANYIGIPSITLPCGMSKSGLPIGAQLMGGWGKEETLYQISLQLETACDVKEELIAYK